MAFDPETVNSYELGWKGSAINRRLELGDCRLLRRLRGRPDPGALSACDSQRHRQLLRRDDKCRQGGLQGCRARKPYRAPGGEPLRRRRPAQLRGFAGLPGRRVQGISERGRFGPDDADHSRAGASTCSDFREVQNTPKWTLSGSLDYDVPHSSGRLNLNSTVSYRSKSQQFEIAIPELDQEALRCGMPTPSGGRRATA